MKLIVNLKLTAKLILSVLIPAVLLLGVTQAYIGVKSFENAKKNGIEQVSAISHEMSAQVESYINQSFESVTVLKNSFNALSESKNPNREDVNLMVAEVVKNNPSYLAIWHMFEQDAFDRKDAQYKKSALYAETGGRLSITYYKDNNKLVNEIATLDQYNEDYYTVPQKNMSNTLLEPYYYSYIGDTSHQVFETSVIVPFIKEKKFLGVVAVDIELSSLGKIISNKIFDSGFASIITYNMQVASHPVSGNVGKRLFSILQNDTIAISNAVQTGKEYLIYENTEDRGEVLRYFSPIHIVGTKTPWSVMIEIPMNEVTQKARSLVLFLITLNVLGMLLFGVVLIYISRSITKPIIRAANFVNSISMGDLTKTITITQKDEIGTMSQNLQQMALKLKLVVSDIMTNAENITAAGNELSMASQQLSEGANEQAASTEEVSSSMEQMGSNINQNADNAKQTEKIALQASHDIEEGSKSVFDTLEAMKQIAEKITIVGVIAEKTDLLAINAAIEAARAGEHGKGFAVVATEVRKLAERSQIAAKEIDELSKTSVRLADESGKVLKRIIPDIQRTSVLVQEISAASMEMNAGASQINNAITQLNTVTQRNATASEEISSSAEELVGQSETLKELVAFFKIGNEESDNSGMNIHSKAPISSRLVKPVAQKVKFQSNNQTSVEHKNLISLNSDDNSFEQY